MFWIFTVRNEVANLIFLQVCVCPQGGACSREVRLILGGGGVCSGGCLLPGGLVSQHALRQTPPGETATAADLRILLECILVDIILSHVTSAAFSFSLWIVWNYYFEQQLTEYLCVAWKTAKLWTKSLYILGKHTSNKNAFQWDVYCLHITVWWRVSLDRDPLDRDPPVNRMTYRCKTLPSRNFVAGGKKGKVGKSRVFVYNF